MGETDASTIARNAMHDALALSQFSSFANL
jgi:hypothetical protein